MKTFVVFFILGQKVRAGGTEFGREEGPLTEKKSTKRGGW